MIRVTAAAITRCLLGAQLTIASTQTFTRSSEQSSELSPRQGDPALSISGADSGDRNFDRGSVGLTTDLSW